MGVSGVCEVLFAEIADNAGDNPGVEAEGVREDPLAMGTMTVDVEEEPPAMGVGGVEGLLATGAVEVEEPLATGVGELVLAEELPTTEVEASLRVASDWREDLTGS